MSMKEAGYSTFVFILDITTFLSSKGPLKASTRLLGVSASSSINRTPLCASETSPGEILSDPPPSRAGREAL